MQPFVLPEQAHPRTGATSAPVAKIALLDDLIPGVGDIPYIQADFAQHEIRKTREMTHTGLVDVVKEKSSLHPACCTFWEPSDDERLCIAAGGAVQVLDFSGKQPLMAVGAMWLSPPEYPRNGPVFYAVARAMYEEDMGGKAPWLSLTSAEQAPWVRRARKAHQVFQHWQKQS